MPEATGDMAVTTGAAPSAPVASPGGSPAPLGSTPDATTSTSASTGPAPTTLAQKLKAATAGSDVVEPPKGPIPFDRHESILAGVRAELQQRDERLEALKWATDYQPDAIQRYAEYDQELAAKGPVQVAFDMLRAAMKRPEHAAQVRSLAARMMRGGNGQPNVPNGSTPAADNAMPGPDAPDGSYTLQGLQKVLAWQERRILATVGKDVAPLKEAHQSSVQQQRQAERSRYVEQRTAQYVAHIEKLPFASENQEAIVAAFSAMPAKTEADLASNMFLAYHQVVDPIRDGKVKQAAISDLTSQAQANSARPTTTTVAGSVVPAKPVRFGQALRERFSAQAGR